MDYAVIFTYSPDEDTSVYLFEDEVSAKGFLRDNYETEILFWKGEGGCELEHEISEDGMFAKITEQFCDSCDITEMRVGRVYL